MPETPPNPLLIAHRGASADAPENTAAAFRLAWNQGADGVECDVRLTADGTLVAIHDADTGRTGNGGDAEGTGLVVADSTLAALRGIEVGSWKHERFHGEPIPTLDDVLALVPAGKRVFIEVKVGVETLPGLLACIGHSALDPEQISVISFDAEVVQAVKRERPELTANWLTAFRRDGERAWTPDASEVLAKLHACGADGVGCQAEFDTIDADFVATLRDAGYAVHLWTVDDPADARHAAALGMDSLTTNRPAALREALSG